MTREAAPKVAINPLKRAVKKILSALESELPSSLNEISVLLTNDSEIRELNARFRKKDKATDVLSFCQSDEDNPTSTTLGDVVISIDTAARQAKKNKVTLAQELLRLLTHGILHLVGYEHERVPKNIAAKMRQKERELERLWVITK